MMVSRGANEREAVQRAGGSDPRLNSVKSGALALVLGTVSEQDILDIHIRKAMPEEKTGASARSLFRLAAYAVRRVGAKGEVRRMEHILRMIAPIELVPKLEFLIVSVLALQPMTPRSGLVDADRVALDT